MLTVDDCLRAMTCKTKAEDEVHVKLKKQRKQQRKNTKEDKNTIKTYHHKI
jgi:hypothetical protein